MTKTTNIENIKGILTALLYTPVQEVDAYPFLVHHPFAEYRHSMNHQGEQLDLLSEEGYKEWLEQIEDIINTSNNIRQVFWVIRKSYRATALKLIYNELSEAEATLLLRETWVGSEAPNTDINVSHKDWINMFKNANPKKLMNSKERKYVNQLPDEITIYRGAIGEYYDALSWTVDYSVAHWFANRRQLGGRIYKAKIKKADVLAYFEHEQEVVINPTKIYDVIVCNKQV